MHRMIAVTAVIAITILPTLAQDEAQPLQALIDAAIAEGAATVTLPAGTHRLESPLRIVKAEGLTIEGAGCTLMLAEGVTHGLQIRQCSGLTLRGLTIDCDPLPFTQGTITTVGEDGASLEFEVHAGYPDIEPERFDKHAYVYEADAPALKRGVADLYQRTTEALDARHGRLTFSPGSSYLANVEPGDRIVLNARGDSAVGYSTCEDVRLENVTVHASYGIAFLMRYMKGECVLSGCKVEPGPMPAGATQPRLMSAGADAFNIAYSRQGPTLDGCSFRSQGDDSVNLHGAVLLVVDRPSPTELICGRPYGGEPLDWLIEAGDTARRLLPGTWVAAGQSPIASCERLREADPALMDRVRTFWPKIKGLPGMLCRLTLAEPLDIRVGDAIDLPDSACPGFAIRNCEFSDHRARALRIMASRGVIEDNVIRRVQQAAITLGPQYVYWREAGWVEDVIVRNNTIEDVGRGPNIWTSNSYTLGAICVFSHNEPEAVSETLPMDNRGIVIEDNQIRGCSLAGVHVGAATDVTVRGNTISRVMYVDAPDAGMAEGLSVLDPIDVRFAAEVTVEGNTVTEVGVSPEALP